MKKYSTLGEFLTEYRAYHRISQLDLAAKLDVDVRTVIRWEKNESLVKQEKEKEFVKKLGIPHQVIRNLNSENPIAIYFDFFRRVYSFSRLSQKVSSNSEFIMNPLIDTDRIRLISKEKEVEFITYVQQLSKNNQPLRPQLVMEAARILPELNLVLYSHSGFCAGHVTILPVKYSSYLKIRNQEMTEGNLNSSDLTFDLNNSPQVFYYYSIYAESIENAYFLINRIIEHFKKNKYKDYIFAGISYRRTKIDFLQEVGLNVVWEKQLEEGTENLATFMEGNLDNFIFKNEGNF